MLDQEKLVKDLESRSKKAKGLAADYKEHGELETSAAWTGKHMAYAEIVHDINKGKFNVKKK